MGVGQGKEGQQEAPPTQLWDPWEGKGQLALGALPGLGLPAEVRVPEGGWAGGASP